MRGCGNGCGAGPFTSLPVDVRGRSSTKSTRRRHDVHRTPAVVVPHRPLVPRGRRAPVRRLRPGRRPRRPLTVQRSFSTSEPIDHSVSSVEAVSEFDLPAPPPPTREFHDRVVTSTRERVLPGEDEYSLAPPRGRPHGREVLPVVERAKRRAGTWSCGTCSSRVRQPARGVAATTRARIRSRARPTYCSATRSGLSGPPGCHQVGSPV